MTAGIRALPLVVMMTTGSTYAFGQPGSRLTCYPIQPGDTAARLAERLTGNAHNRHRPWFQIVEPTTETVIAKSHYGRIQSGWHVCVATEMLVRAPAPPRSSLVVAGPSVLLTAGVSHVPAAIEPGVLNWAAPAIVVSGLVLAWIVARASAGKRRARLGTMKRFGERFISEFERPLFRRRAGEPAIRSRMRFRPRRRRLEVLLAPADGRTYPNLVDHRKNVEYDVARVLRIVRDAPFSNGPPYAEGSWVVIPFRLETDRQQEGVP